MSNPAVPLHVLVVEDDPGDVLLIVEAFAASTLHTRLSVVGDGSAALASLHAEDVCPDIVLLDLNLPGLSGREVLAAVKADPRLCTIPVVVFTTSAAAEDIAECYRSHANAYVTKPVDFDEFKQVIDSIDHFFAETVVLARTAE
jgi:two-component system response regulator